jgi:hypothetical protein
MYKICMLTYIYRYKHMNIHMYICLHEIWNDKTPLHR